MIPALTGVTIRVDGVKGGTMPRTSRRVQGRNSLLPGTLRRSCKEAQEMFIDARDRAVQTYGEGDEAYRIAYSALKRKFEKRGDHWIPKQAPSG